jgi:hypothetical protein
MTESVELGADDDRYRDLTIELVGVGPFFKEVDAV